MKAPFPVQLQIRKQQIPKTFQSHGHFKHHINSDHGGDYVEPKVLRDRLECPICHSKCYPNKSLKDHLKKDHKVSKDPKSKDLIPKLNLQKTIKEDRDHKTCTILENLCDKIDEGSKANILDDRGNKVGNTNLLFDSTYILTAVLFFGSHMYIIYESPLIKVKNHGVILSFH